MRGISCIVLAFFATSLMAGEVYRSVDANGVVTYSDTPENSHSQLVHVATTTPAGESTPAPAANAPATAAAKTAPKPAGGKAAEDKPTPAELAAQRQKNCKIAQQRVQSYAVAHRLYRKTPDGGRQYLNSKEIDEARARAAADVAKWCG